MVNRDQQPFFRRVRQEFADKPLGDLNLIEERFLQNIPDFEAAGTRSDDGHVPRNLQLDEGGREL